MDIMFTAIEYCLGWSLLGQCDSYFNSEYSIFNIGIFLGVIGVLFAGYQLVEPIHKLRMRFRKKKIILANLVFLIAFIFCLIGMILPFIPGYALPLVGYSVFWEILSVVFISLGLGIYGFVCIRPIKRINKENLDTLFQISLSSQLGNDKYTESLAFELAHFFPSFLFLYKEQEKTYAENEIQKRWSGEQCPKKDLLINGFYFFSSITNEKLIDKICENAKTCNVVFSEYVTKRIEFIYQEKEFIKLLLLRSLGNSNSVLFKELSGKVMPGLYMNNGVVLNEILENLYLFDEIDFFDEMNFINLNIKEKNAILKLIEKIFTKLNMGGNQNLSCDCRKKLVLGASQILAQLIPNSYQEISFVGCLTTLYELGISKYDDINSNDHYLQDDRYLFGVIHKYQITEEKYTILDGIAWSFFECIKSFASIEEDEKNTFKIRDLSLTLIMRFEDLNENIKKRLSFLIKNQICQNIRGYHPMVSRIFWHIFGFQFFSEIANGQKLDDEVLEIVNLYTEKLPDLNEGRIYAYTDEYLKNEYHKKYAIKKAGEILSALFPVNMTYDHSTKTLTYAFFDNSSIQTFCLSDGS